MTEKKKLYQWRSDNPKGKLTALGGLRRNLSVNKNEEYKSYYRPTKWPGVQSRRCLTVKSTTKYLWAIFLNLNLIWYIMWNCILMGEWEQYEHIKHEGHRLFRWRPTGPTASAVLRFLSRQRWGTKLIMDCPILGGFFWSQCGSIRWFPICRLHTNVSQRKWFDGLNTGNGFGEKCSSLNLLFNAYFEIIIRWQFIIPEPKLIKFD